MVLRVESSRQARGISLAALSYVYVCVCARKMHTFAAYDLYMYTYKMNIFARASRVSRAINNSGQDTRGISTLASRLNLEKRGTRSKCHPAVLKTKERANSRVLGTPGGHMCVRARSARAAFNASARPMDDKRHVDESRRTRSAARGPGESSIYGLV